MSVTVEPSQITITETEIEGLLIIGLVVYDDQRGFFKENFDRKQLVAAGCPISCLDMDIQNISYNRRGATRGIHAEPWDKYISVAYGRAFAAFVDLRRPGFRRKLCLELGPDTAVFVPYGVGNSFQALEEPTVYSYMVNGRWKPNTCYKAVDLADPELAIPWPIDRAFISDKDLRNPRLCDVEPF